MAQCCSSTPDRKNKTDTTIRVDVEAWPVQLPTSMPAALQGMTSELAWKEFAEDFNASMREGHDQTKQYIGTMIIASVFLLGSAVYGAVAQTAPAQVAVTLALLGVAPGLGAFYLPRRWDSAMYLRAKTNLCDFCQDKVVADGKVIFDLMHDGVVKASCVGCIGERSIPLLEVTTTQGSLEEPVRVEDPPPKKRGSKASLSGMMQLAVGAPRRSSKEALHSPAIHAPKQELLPKGHSGNLHVPGTESA